MDKQQAAVIVEGLRKAQIAGAPVLELHGQEARNFAFVKDEASRKHLLGSFCIDAGKKFFVSVVSSPNNDDDYGFVVFDRLGGNVLLASNLAQSDGVVWKYQPSKQDGSNQARKDAFRDAANAESLTFPVPREDIGEFSAAVTRAIELRQSADAAGDDANEGSTWLPPNPILPPRSKLPPSRLGAATVPGVVWKLCAIGQGATLSQLQQALDALGLDGPHTGRGMLSRYATQHGCNVTVRGSGKDAAYSLTPPGVTTVVDGEGSDSSAEESGSSREVNGSDFEAILDRLRAESLSFSAELVASYLLALQAKRFVLLTGISGTGKTRLAQEIARMFGPTVVPAPVPTQEVFELTVKPYHLKRARFAVPAELAQEFSALADPDFKRIDLELPGKAPMSMAIYKADSGNQFTVLLSGDARVWFESTLQLDERFLLERRKRGEQEWIALSLPGAEMRTVPAAKTYELIAVRPDWTDARALLGFYNPLTRSYISTPTLQLLLRAQEEVNASNDGTLPWPHFLIFDEMNLARVEHYFSDFLSAMESGEPIHLHDDLQVEEGEDIPRRLTIPENVFVIGTVNVDETTYMFSPKVLDRAFVLEFNDVDLGGLAGPVDSETSESTPLSLLNLEGGLKLRGQGSSDEWKRFETFLGGEARRLFGRIHDALAIENRHFGYRVAREVARFVDLAVEQAGTSDATVRAALDVAVLAKILPKLHGSQAEIEATLKRLVAIATGDKPESEVFTPHGAMFDGAVLPLPRTARKLGRMLYRLRANGFVSFIE